MPTPKGKPVPERSIYFIANKRAKARDQHYKMLKTVKAYNLRGEPVGFRELCENEHYHEVAEFIREAESWGILESQIGEKPHRRAVRVLIVTSVGDAFLKHYEAEKGIS